MRSRALFYKSVVQAVLIYWSEIWFTMDSMMKVLEGLHNHITMRIAGKAALRFGEEGWKYPPMDESLEAGGLWSVQE